MKKDKNSVTAELENKSLQGRLLFESIQEG